MGSRFWMKGDPRARALTMLERIAAACGVALKLRAEKKPHFDREIALA
jgi:hypothetical protein